MDREPSYIRTRRTMIIVSSRARTSRFTRWSGARVRCYVCPRSHAHAPLLNVHTDEELLLLEGVSLYGLGNWPDIAEHVQTKTADDCKAHFFAVYVDAPTFPEPVRLGVVCASVALTSIAGQAPSLSQAEVDAHSPMPVHPKIQEKVPVSRFGTSGVCVTAICCRTRRAASK